MGEEGGSTGDNQRSEEVPSSNHGSFHHMMCTYNEHGADNLSLWLTNAKDAAAKIREATRAQRKEKQETYTKFLRDLQSRVAVFTEERKFSSMRIPPAKATRTVEGANHCSVWSRLAPTCCGDQKDLRNQVPRVEKVRDFPDKQRRKSSKSPTRYRECMITALMRDKPYSDYTAREEETKRSARRDNRAKSVKGPVKTFIEDLPTTDTSQNPESLESESCTTTQALDAWSIPTSFPGAEMRNPKECGVQVTHNSGSDDRIHSEGLKVYGATTKFALRLPLQQKSTTIASRVGQSLAKDLSMEESEMFNEKIDGHHCHGETSFPNASLSPRKSILQVQDGAGSRQSEYEHAMELTSLMSGDGVTVCSMGVVVVRGREEYEARGQGKQFFSDVWKCAMEVERRRANEHARWRSAMEKKRYS